MEAGILFVVFSSDLKMPQLNLDMENLICKNTFGIVLSEYINDLQKY